MGLAAVQVEIDRFNEDLAVEKQERYTQVEEATAGLLTHLDRIREDLAATSSERVVTQARYQTKFIEKFETLDRVLEAETCTRQAAWETCVSELKDVYQDLHEKEDGLETDIQIFLENERISLKAEEVHREGQQEEIIERTVRFLDALKENMTEDVHNSRHRDDLRKGYMKIPLASPL